MCDLDGWSKDGQELLWSGFTIGADSESTSFLTCYGQASGGCGLWSAVVSLHFVLAWSWFGLVWPLEYQSEATQTLSAEMHSCQVSGGRLLVCCNIADACRFYGTADLKLVCSRSSHATRIGSALSAASSSSLFFLCLAMFPILCLCSGSSDQICN